LNGKRKKKDLECVAVLQPQKKRNGMDENKWIPIEREISIPYLKDNTFAP